MVQFDPERLAAARHRAAQELLQARHPGGHWRGAVSSSTPATAAAVCAVSLVDTEWKSAEDTLRRLTARGVEWLVHHANGDGGWGDTPRSFSNLSATTLAWAALGLAPAGNGAADTTARAAEKWICQKAGNTAPAILVPMLRNRFSGDLAVPAGLLMACALAGRLGGDIRAWRHVPALPFERACCSPDWWAGLRLPSASWAAPLFLAAGLARHHNLPSRWFVTRLWREFYRASGLDRLAALQAEDGSWQASPLVTGLVTVGLVAAGYARHPATEKGIKFLAATIGEDGSWPIGAAEEVTLTAQAVQALVMPALGAASPLPMQEVTALRHWLVVQQRRCNPDELRNFTGSWAAAPHPGDSPDAATTTEALLALRLLGDPSPETIHTALGGVNWLLSIQNPDGGIPPFRRGWRRPPTEHGAADDTALGLRAWLAWLHVLSPDHQHRVQSAIHNAVRFLMDTQGRDGAWCSLRFGDQYADYDENPTLGTARVLQALPELVARSYFELVEPLNSGVLWLLKNQNTDGSWGGGRGGPPSVEETALALDALAESLLQPQPLLLETRDQARNAVAWGTNWLVQQIESGKWTTPAPVGLRWGRFWYYEPLYPLIFTSGALGKVARLV